jgi:hypothetical protein
MGIQIELNTTQIDLPFAGSSFSIDNVLMLLGKASDATKHAVESHAR